MAKRKHPKSAGDSEQLQLIDVASPLAKALKPIAKKYKAAQEQRQIWLAEEIEQKEKIIALVNDDKTIKPDADGVKRIEFDGIRVKITPRDELVQVRFRDESDGDGDGDGE